MAFPWRVGGAEEESDREGRRVWRACAGGCEGEKRSGVSSEEGREAKKRTIRRRLRRSTSLLLPASRREPLGPGEGARKRAGMSRGGMRRPRPTHR